MDSGERGMNPVAMTIINPRKVYWLSRGSNQPPPILKSATLPTELWGYAHLNHCDAPNFGLSQIERVRRHQFQTQLKLRKFYTYDKKKKVEGKGEIARSEQFLFFSQSFSEIFMGRSSDSYYKISQSLLIQKILRGSVVTCLTHNPVFLGWNRTGSSGIFVRVSLGKTLQSPSPVPVKSRKDLNTLQVAVI